MTRAVLPQGYALQPLLTRVFASEAAAAAAEKKAQKKAEKKAKVKIDANVTGDKVMDAFNVQMQVQCTVCAHQHQSPLILDGYTRPRRFFYN